MKKMFKYTLTLLVIGIILVIVGVSLNGTFDIIPLEVESLELKSEEELENIENINIDLNSADIFILHGDNANIKIYASENKKYNTDIMKIADGSIEIMDQPEDELDKKVYITVNDKIESLKIKLRLGDIHIEDVELKNAILNNDVGNIYLREVLCDNDSEDDALTTELDMGSIYIDNIISQSLRATVDLGNLNISGDIKDIKASVEAGNIQVLLDREEKDYDIVTNVSLGATNKSFLSHADNAYGTINLKVNLGNINLLFEQSK